MMKKEPRKNRKKGRKEKEMNTRTTKNDLQCNDKNDPWSDYPETQFEPIYLFFRNHKPWPTLHT